MTRSSSRSVDVSPGSPPGLRSASDEPAASAPPPVGVGFRSRHFPEILERPGLVDWFEVVSDNFIGVGGPRARMLDTLRASYPIALHGVGLSIAGTDPLSRAYLDGLRALADRVEPAWVSDHLCWTGIGGKTSHDLLPVAYTTPVLDHVVARVDAVQSALGRRLLLENATTYVAFRDDEMDEATFLAALAHRTGCGVLLDVNNLYVNAANLGLDPIAYLNRLPRHAVGYLHLAGHAVLPDVRIDTHDAAVPEAVWSLYERAVERFPSAGVVIERDDDLPAYADLAAEASAARDRWAVGAARRRGRTPCPHDARGAAVATGAPHAAAAPWRDTQRRFWSLLVAGPAPATGGAPAEILDDDRPVARRRGMRVYSDAYARQLSNALATNFPTLVRVIASDDFTRLASAYARRHPPEGHAFRDFTRPFARFVEGFAFASDYGVGSRVLAEIVALEQAQLEVQDDADAPTALPALALRALAPDAWEDVRFDFVPALRIVHATHDVQPVVDAVAADRDPARPARRATSYLVSRGPEGVRTDALPPMAARVLEGLVGGLSFGAAVVRIAALRGRDDPNIVTASVGALALAAERGLLAGVRRPAGRRRRSRRRASAAIAAACPTPPSAVACAASGPSIPTSSI